MERQKGRNERLKAEKGKRQEFIVIVIMIENP